MKAQLKKQADESLVPPVTKEEFTTRLKAASDQTALGKLADDVMASALSVDEKDRLIAMINEKTESLG